PRRACRSAVWPTGRSSWPSGRARGPRLLLDGSSLGSCLELGLDDAAIGRAAVEQSVMGAEADDLTVLEDDDLVGMADGGDPLRDDDDAGIAGPFGQCGP